ncbi:MAG TPA: hypothetical protein VK177_12155 [Flavobacteriales bacterium]|nr:hypothetical protein [Flavobacteriales bacterium]
MRPPGNVTPYDIPLSTMWFDEQGIFCSIAKKNASITKEALEDSFNFIRKHVGEKKICWIGDVTHAAFPTKEAREYAGEETPKLVQALAIIVNSEISKLVANAFLRVQKPPYPTKMFTNEKEAREWLQQYL